MEQPRTVPQEGEDYIPMGTFFPNGGSFETVKDVISGKFKTCFKNTKDVSVTLQSLAI